jgi:hypothetical protein
MLLIITRYFTFFLVLGLSCSPILAASITVTPAGSGAFAVLGDGMTGVAGIDITLGYDSSALASPSVTQGGLVSGALFTANTNLPGLVRIAIIKSTPFPGNGQIATISFAVNNGSVGLTSISARLIDVKGASLPVQTSITAGLSSTPAPLINSPATSSSIQTATGTAILGTVAMPVDTQKKNEPKPAVEPPGYVSPPEPVPVSDDVPRQQEKALEKAVAPEKAVEPKKVSYGSVLERFKLYQGDRTPAAMNALFEKPVAPELRQEPSIAATDGSTKVRIYADLPAVAGSSPNFSLSGAKVVSVAHDEVSGTLVIEVLPEINSTQASVTILSEYSIVTVPLTLVPAAVVSKQEGSFADFLMDTGVKKPRFDLNNDGVHDYVDDYIYTGQYLIKKAAAENKAKK